MVKIRTEWWPLWKRQMTSTYTQCIILTSNHSCQQMHIKKLSITIFASMYDFNVFCACCNYLYYNETPISVPSKDGKSDQFHDHHLLKTFVNDKFGKTGSTCDVEAWLSSKYNRSVYGATDPSVSCPHSEDASILLLLLLVSSTLLFLGSVMCPSGRRPSILFLVFPLVFFYEISQQELFWGDNFVFHS